MTLKRAHLLWLILASACSGPSSLPSTTGAAGATAASRSPQQVGRAPSAPHQVRHLDIATRRHQSRR